MIDIARLHELFTKNPEADILEFDGSCHDCQRAVLVEIKLSEQGFAISGGALYETEPDRFFLKCDDCYSKNKHLTSYQPCEVYSRVVGYLRPVSQWNEGKQAGFKDRTLFRIVENV